MVQNEIPDTLLIQLFRNIDSPVKKSMFSPDTYANYFIKAKLNLPLTSDLVTKGRVEERLMDFFGGANFGESMGVIYNISMENYIVLLKIF